MARRRPPRPVRKGKRRMEPGPLGKLERRILGVLVEKAFCTPDAYPLTPNAIVAGCSQKSARDPVMETNADQVEEALEALKGQGLVLCIQPSSGRTDRWRHSLKDAWDLDGRERALLAELLLRGPQTEAELRANAKRMQDCGSPDEVAETLAALAEDGFVQRLSPAGQKRGVVWAHLLYAPEELSRLADRHGAAAEPDGDPAPAASPERGGAPVGGERLRQLEEQVRTLAAKLDDLTQAYDHLLAKVERLTG